MDGDTTAFQAAPVQATPPAPRTSAATNARERPAWVQYLATALRLCDAHDCAREVGATYAALPDEARRGTSDGRYVTIAWGLLEHLRDRELGGSLDYVSVTEYIRDAAATHGLTEADVHYVVNLLATPTKLSFVDLGKDGARSRATTETALVEKQRRGYGCRLAIAGREALGFASGYFKWVHAGIESQKLLVDLRNGDFPSFHQVAVRILDRIRQECLEVRRAIERPEVEDLRQHFLDHADRYTGTIEEVLGVIGDVQRLLMTDEVQEGLARHAAAADDDDMLSASLFNALLQDILNALRDLQKLFSRFVLDVQRRDKALVGVVRFDEVARAFAAAPPGPATDVEALEAMLRGIGPLMADRPAFAPTELRGLVETRRPRSRTPPAFRRLGNPAGVKERLELFVERNRERLLARLREGPLGLTEILEREDFLDFRDLEGAIEATALVVSPLVLRFEDLENTRIRIAVGDRRAWLLPDGWEISGRELTLTLEEDVHGL